MIYFMHCRDTGRIKIGYSADPWSRFVKVQSDSPTRITLRAIIEGDQGGEAALHARFSASRERGEWFAATTDLAAYVDGLPVAVAPAKRRRDWHGLTDEEISEVAGLSRAQANRIRNGKCRPSLDTALKLAAATGKPVETLFPLDRAA
jgi:DNA-binding XRE family transcriptional regulator